MSNTDWCICAFSCGCGIPLSFKMCYYRLYHSAKNEKELNIKEWTFHMIWAMLWATWIILSVPRIGINIYQIIKNDNIKYRGHGSRHISNYECFSNK